MIHTNQWSNDGDIQCVKYICSAAHFGVFAAVLYAVIQETHYIIV